MPFQYSDQHRIEYFTTGLTVLRGVIPASLLADLRRETDRAREIARRSSGPQSQRLQPVYKYEELNHRPFRDFLQLPGLRASVEEFLARPIALPTTWVFCSNRAEPVVHQLASRRGSSHNRIRYAVIPTGGA
jgi:hypothetical protein